MSICSVDVSVKKAALCWFTAVFNFQRLTTSMAVLVDKRSQGPNWITCP